MRLDPESLTTRGAKTFRDDLKGMPFSAHPRVEADGKAIGGACRHALRGIEDCYRLNEKALKTAVFEGWKEMDIYMRENKIEGIPPKEVAAEAEPVEEVIVDDKKTKSVASKDKPAGKAPLH